MHQTYTRGRLLEVFLFAVAALLLFAAGLKEIVFLIPIQMAGARRGWRSLLMTAGAALLLFAGYALALYLSAPVKGQVALMRLLIQPLAPVTVLILGLVIVNLPALGRRRLLVRLLCASASIAAIAVPCLIMAPRIPLFQDALDAIFKNIFDQAFSAAALGPASPLTELFQPGVLKAASVELFLMAFLPLSFLILSMGYWAGALLGRRTLPEAMAGAPPITRFSSFKLESWFLWPSIILVAALLADYAFTLSSIGLHILGYAAWNLGLLAIMLYGLQGMAIIKFIFEKYRMPRIIWVLTVPLVVIMLVLPARILILIGIPGLGVSETWIRYRIPADPVSDDD